MVDGKVQVMSCQSRTVIISPASTEPASQLLKLGERDFLQPRYYVLVHDTTICSMVV